MDTATAETIQFQPNRPELFLVQDEQALPAVIAVPEMGLDELSRHRAARFIGEVMLDQTVQDAELFKHEKPIESLRDGIKWAAEGDEDGSNLVEINVSTDVVERTLKKGHVTDPVKLEATPDGKFVQYNQNTDTIYANSLQLAAGSKIMQARTEAETRNKFRVEELYKAGYFKDNNLVVFSLADNIPDIFFTETMSCSIQVLSEIEDGLQLESAFVAGIAEPGAERHDLETIGKVGDMLQVNFRGKTPAQIIDIPILIPKDQMPDGATNMAELWDKARGGISFFGENKPAPCSYQEYRELCRERTTKFRPRVESIRDQLISEAASIKTRLQAIERLHELSEQHMVEYAIEDETIDPRVFGPIAAPHIEMARWHREMGNIEQAHAETATAISTAQSKSCPWVKNSAEGVDNQEDSSTKPDNSLEECEFVSKECPVCHKKNVKTTVTKTHIKGDCGCVKKK